MFLHPIQKKQNNLSPQNKSREIIDNTNLYLANLMNSMYGWIFLASQNILIYRNTASEAISPPNLTSDLSIDLLLTIALISCTILIVVLYRRINQNNLKSQLLVQNLQQRVEVLETKFIAADV